MRAVDMAEKKASTNGSTGARTPTGTRTPPNASKKVNGTKVDFGSEGVEDNDVFLLPVSDYQTMGILTLVAAVIRLFRIYQPSSVVFDEVQ